VEYKNEGFSLFETLIKNIQVNTVQTLMRMELKPIVPQTEVIQMQTNEKEITDIETGSRELIPTHKTSTGRPTVVSADDDSQNDPRVHQEIYGVAKPSSPSQNVIRVNADASQAASPLQDVPKVGRNDDCPCGSGKKYKKCHGRE
jgi:preprotein translocase subunit SecA